MSSDDKIDAVNAAARAARRTTAATRDRRVRGEGPLLETRGDAPTARPTVEGQCMVFGELVGGKGWTLFGTRLNNGDRIEMYTNVANGWLKGRFRWNGEREKLPVLYMNVWDPSGKRNDRGQPPLVGELESYIPEGAKCRWLAAFEEVD